MSAVATGSTPGPSRVRRKLLITSRPCPNRRCMMNPAGLWIQPTTTVASGVKISALVKVRIEKDGRVSDFEIIKPSENVVVNESVAVVAKRVTQVDSPPPGLMKGDHYDVKINFELNTEQAAAK